MKRIILIFGLLALFSVRSVLNAKNINEVLGVTHTGGKYCLTKEPFIIEGAHKIDSMGFKTIKFFLSKDMASLYPYNSEWELSKMPHGQRLLAVNILTKFSRWILKQSFSILLTITSNWLRKMQIFRSLQKKLAI